MKILHKIYYSLYKQLNVAVNSKCGNSSSNVQHNLKGLSGITYTSQKEWGVGSAASKQLKLSDTDRARN